MAEDRGVDQGRRDYANMVAGQPGCRVKVYAPCPSREAAYSFMRHLNAARTGVQSRAMSTPAPTPDPPYYAVIFTSTRTAEEEGYGDMAAKMVEMAAQQPGFLGVESARGADGLGITVSYWESEEAIAAWRANAEHRIAQAQGRGRWYAEFVTRVAKVERARTFTRDSKS